MAPSHTENFITTKQASELSGYSPDYLARLARSGKISGKRIGHSWLVERESLERFMNDQGDRNTDRARELARAREAEYRAHRSSVSHITRTLTKTFSMSQESAIVVGIDAGSAASRFCSRALALSVALLVVVAGALGARAAALPRLALPAAALANEAAVGFGVMLDDGATRVAARVEKAGAEREVLSQNVAGAIAVATADIASSLLAHANFSLSPIAVLDESPNQHRAAPASLAAHPDTAAFVPITIEGAIVSVRGAYEFITTPSLVASTLASAHSALGAEAYAAINDSFSGYRSLIERAGEGALAFGAVSRDAFAFAPRFVDRLNLAFGTAVIDVAYVAIRADVAVAYGLAETAPASARYTTELALSAGDALSGATSRAPALAAMLYLRAATAPAELAPRLARAIFGAEYAAAERLLAFSRRATEDYLALVEGTGRLAYSGTTGALAFSESTASSVINAPVALENAYLGALGRSALALRSLGGAGLAFDTLANIPLLAAAQPALSGGERVALATYETISGFMRSARGAFAAIFGSSPLTTGAPPPTIVMPSVPQKARVAVATSTPRLPAGRQGASTPAPQIVNSYPSYTTVVQGVSQDSVARSLAALRADVLATAASLIRPVAAQTATNATTIQYVNMIQDLSNLIVRNGDFRGGSLSNGVLVSATTGTFTNLTGGSLSVNDTATSTFAGNLSVAGNINFDGAFLQDGAPFVGSQWTTSGSNIYYSTGSVGIGTTSPSQALSVQGNGLFSGDLSVANLTATGTVTIGSLTGVVAGNAGSLYAVASSSLFGFTPVDNAITISGTYPIMGGGDLSTNRTFALAFGTTTSNTWANTQTFTNAPTLSTFSGLVAGNAGATYAVSTTSLNASITGNAGTVTTNANLSGVVTSVGNTTSFGSQTAGVLGSSITGNTAPMATSSLYGVSTGGKVLGWDNTTGGIGWVSTTTAGSVTSVTGSWPILSSGGATPNLTWGGIATSSNISAASGLLYATGVNTFASIATSSAISMSITGLAGTATALATARTINGISFDGTANIVVASTTLLGDTNTWSGTNTFSTLPVLGTLSGLIAGNNGSLYQVASSSLFGFTPVDNAITISGTYPITGGGDLTTNRTFALAFGTTTSNTWANTQTFTNAPVLSTFSGLIGANTGATYQVSTSTLNIGGTASNITGIAAIANGGTGLSSITGNRLLYSNATGSALLEVATSSPTLGLGLSYSGTLGALVGGASGSLTIATSSLYSGTTGQLPYFSGTNTLTATSSIFLATSGNVGVGTASPSYPLHVAGQCVTADTRLRRRRKKKEGECADAEKGEWEDGEYIYDLPMIKDIRANDDVRSLDMSSGALEWSRVNGIMYTGIQNLIRITTQSGRSIRTTAVHPYFVHAPRRNENKTPQQKLYRFYADQSVRFDEYARDTYIAIANEEQSFVISIPKLVKQALRDAVPDMGHRKVLASAMFGNALALLSRISGVRMHELAIDTEYTGTAHESIITAILKGLDPELAVSFEQVGKKSSAHKAAYGAFIGKRTSDITAGTDTLFAQMEHVLGGDSFRTSYDSIAELRPARSLQGDGGIALAILRKTLWESGVVDGIKTENALRTALYGYIHPAHHSPQTSSDNDRIGRGARLVNEGLWIQAQKLKVGHEIAVVYGDTPSWERVTKVEHLPAESVYDVEIEGTHNFIGNDIVAHNTYIGGNLTVASTATIGSLSGLVAGNSGVLYAVASSSLFGFTPVDNAITISGTYPITGGGDLTTSRTFALAFGTTTSNTWASTQTFTNAPVLSTFSGLVAGNAGATYAVSTTSLNASITGNAGTVTTNANLSGVVTSVGNTTSFGSQTAGVLGSSITGNTAPMATSTLYGVSSGGKVLGWDNATGGIGWVSTTTAGSVTSVTGSWPIISSGGATPNITWGGLATSSPLAAASGLLYATGVNTFASIATSSAISMSITGNAGTVTNGVYTTDTGTVTNTMLAGSIAASKLSLAKGNFIVGNDAGVAQATSTIFISSTGNVGIGTTSPWGLLSVNPNGITGPAFVVGSSTATNFIVANNGNIGIGTAGPEQKLDIAGGNITLDDGYAFGDDTYPNYEGYIPKLVSDDGGVLQSSSNLYFNIDSNNNETSRAFVFAHDNTTSLGTELFRIQENGNVGIGTTSPSSLLSVHGNGYFSGTGFFGGAITGTSTLAIQSTTATSTFSTGGLTVGTSQFVVQQTSGNVGVGTASPAYPLHVAGQCVTADTRLRRRRRRRRGETDEILKKSKAYAWDDEYVYEEIEIVYIEKDDEIASMNQKTGRFVWSRVNGLLDMGVQPLIKLRTLSSREIRTTSVHPYFVRTGEYREREAHKTQKLYRFEVDLSMKIENYASDTVIALANGENALTLKIPRQVKQTLRDALRPRRPREFLPAIYAAGIVEALRRVDASVHELKIDTDYLGHDDVIARIINASFPGVHLLFAQVGKKSPAHFAAYGVHTGKEPVDHIATLDELKMRINAESALPVSFPAHKGAGSESHQTLPDIASIESGDEFVKRGKWTTASELRVGQEIAVAHGNIPAWERIVEIKELPQERVYDIEIEGTHNFIGNDIIAHNTYIGGNLTVASAATIGSLSGVVAGNAGALYAVASSSPTLGLGLSYSGTLGALVGGASGSLTVATSSLYSGTTGQLPYFSGTNTLTATSSIFLATSGNVGIGVTSPVTNLHIRNSGVSGKTFSNNAGLVVENDGSSNSYYALQVSTAGANDAFSITNAGNVGIGTANPATSLEIGKLAGATTTLTNSNTVISAGDLLGALAFRSEDNSTNGTLVKAYVQGVAETTFTGGNHRSALYFGTAASDVVATTKMVLSSDGYLGIGNTSPSYKLDVAGFINTDQYSGYKQAGNTVLYASTTNRTLAVGASGAAGWMSASSTNWYSVAVGQYALGTAPTSGQAQYNTAVGYSALFANTTGYYNTATGYSALGSNTIGTHNSAFGIWALSSNTTGVENTAVGYNAIGNSITGSQNTVVGRSALSNNLSATNTVAVGTLAAQGTAAYNNQGGTYLGYYSGYSAQTGSDYNTLIGYQSGYGVTSGARNILIGQSTISASYNQVTTGSNNIAIGNDVAVASPTASNQLNIGNLIFATGVDGTGTTISSGKVGIGTTSPFAKLSVNQVEGDVGFVIGSSTATSFIVDKNGNVGIGTANPRDSRWKIDAIGSGIARINLTSTNNEAYLNVDSATDDDVGISFQNNGTEEWLLYKVQATNDLRFNDGSDRVTFKSGGNTGIGSTTPWGLLSVNANALAAGTPQFVVGSSTATNFIVANNGNVGIGTTAPDYKFDVVGGIRLLGGSGTDGELAFTDGKGYFRTLSGGTGEGDFWFRTWDGSMAHDALVIKEGGNVGIGTTTPGSLLSIGGTGTGWNFFDNATTTSYAKGIDLKNGGCFAVNGTCVGGAGGSGTVGSGTTGQFPYYAADGTTLTATSSLFLAASGNIGIGTTGPGGKLHVKGDSGVNMVNYLESVAAGSYLEMGTSAGGYVELNGDSSGNFNLSTNGIAAGVFQMIRASSVANTMVLKAGNIGIGTASPDSIKLDVEDDIEVGTGTTGCVRDADNTTLVGSCVSDRQLKTNITALPSDTLNKLAQLTPVSFEWRNDEFGWLNGQPGVNYGLIAQEVEQVFPEMVHTDDRGYKRVSYDIGLSMRLLQGVRELNAKFLIPTGAMASTSSPQATLPAEVLTAGGEGIDLYKLATFSLAEAQALAERVGAVEIRLVSLEDRVAMLESGAISTASGSPLTFSTTSLASALQSFGVDIMQGLAHFVKIATDNLQVGSPAHPTGITMYDKTTGQPYCFQIDNGAATTTQGACADIAVASAQTAMTDSTSSTSSGQTSSPQATTTDAITATTTATATASTTDSDTTASTTGSTSSPQATTTPIDTTPPAASDVTPPAVSDVEPPVVTLVGDAALQINVGDAFTDPGATATDDTDGDLTTHINVSGAVDTATAGLYELTYSALDAAGNTGSASRIVTVVAPLTAPVDTSLDTGATETTP